MKDPKLTLNLVPQNLWGQNLRSVLSRRDWDLVRKDCYKRAQFRCEICGDVGKKHPVECHEQWNYDDTNHILTLTGLLALCPSCHQVKHWGRSEGVGLGQVIRNHLMQVNGWDIRIAILYVEAAFDQWERRSVFDWSLNTDWIQNRLEDINSFKGKGVQEFTF